MTRKFVYFIENEKGEWYRFNHNATLKPHTNSSDRAYKCLCDDCTGNGKDFYPWTIDPLEAASFPKEALPRMQKRIAENKSWNDWFGMKITEHEFVEPSALTHEPSEPSKERKEAVEENVIECEACKWSKKNRENAIKMIGPLAYNVPGKCKEHS